MEPRYLYHIYNRGNNNELIFREEKNYYFFLQNFSKYVKPYVKVFAYCLMPNHFHFLIEIKRGSIDKVDGTTQLNKVFLNPVEKAFKDFFIKYSKSFNKTYSRFGSLFQHKFKRKLIEDEKYLTRLIAYIHYNPVRKNLCDNINEWKFSSYNEIITGKQFIVNNMDILLFFGELDNFIEFHKCYSDSVEDKNTFY